MTPLNCANKVALNDRDGKVCLLEELSSDDADDGTYRFKTLCGFSGVSAWLGMMAPIWHIGSKQHHAVNCLDCLAK